MPESRGHRYEAHTHMAGVPAQANKSCPIAPMAEANEGRPKMMRSGERRRRGMREGEEASGCGERPRRGDQDENRRDVRQLVRRSEDPGRTERSDAPTSNGPVCGAAAGRSVTATAIVTVNTTHTERSALWFLQEEGITYVLLRWKLPRAQTVISEGGETRRERGRRTGSRPADPT